MEKRIEVCALIAVKTIEGLYGKINIRHLDDGENYYEEEIWDFSSLDGETNIEERETILQCLNVDVVKEMLQKRYNLFQQEGYVSMKYNELDEFVMWANNNFIHP